MRTDDRIREEVEKTLHAFDNDLPLEPNPFLFTRIRAQRGSQSDGRRRRYVRDIGLRWIVIFGFLLLNLITVAHYAEWNIRHARQQTLVSQLEKDFPVDTSPGDY